MVKAGLTALLATGLVVVATPESASALPPVCSTSAAIVWDGQGIPAEWNDPDNWGGAGVPVADGIVCIGISDFVEISDGSPKDLDQLHLAGGAQLQVDQGNELFVNGTAESLVAAGSSLNVLGQVGGTGTMRVQGNVSISSSPTATTFLSSDPTTGGGQPPPADKGDLVVEGHASIAGTRGVGVAGGYRMTVAAGGSLSVQPGAWLAADNGTAMTIDQGGTFDIGGDGGFYLRAAVGGQPVTSIVNNGVLRKTSGAGLSIVEGSYTGGGQVVVQSGLLGMPDNQKIIGTVAPGAGLATARCGTPATTTFCSTSGGNSAADPNNLLVTIPGANGANASVAIQELPPVGPAVDPQGIGNEVLAHVDNLTANTATPARIDIRYSQADVMSTPLDQIQVVHTEDSGQEVLLPTCGPGGMPAGLFTCVLRPAIRTPDATIVTVLTNVTSRWRVRRGPTIENQGAPTQPQGVTVKKVDGGAKVKVSWKPPATSGAGPISTYEVKLDGKTKQTAETSYVVKNPGPGKHKYAVAALNAAGTSGYTPTTKLKLGKLSAPRKPKGVAGKAGGRATAGLTWKQPSSAGGLKIKAYLVAIFDARGRKVATTKAKGKLRKLQVTLPSGRYRFRLRAKNADGTGPWSKYTGFVQAR